MLRRLFILASLAILAALLCLWPRTRTIGDELSYVSRAGTYWGIGTHPHGIQLSRMTNVNARRPDYDPISLDEQRRTGFTFESYKWTWLDAIASTGTTLPPMSPSTEPVGTGTVVANLDATVGTSATPPASEDPRCSVSVTSGSASDLVTVTVTGTGIGRFWTPPPHHFLGFGYERATDGWSGVNGTPIQQKQVVFDVPLWFLCLLLVVPSAYWIPMNLRRRWRSHWGKCVRCGYDLRATPGRCPECGHVPRAAG